MFPDIDAKPSKQSLGYSAFRKLDEAVEKGKLVYNLPSELSVHISDMAEMYYANRSFTTKVYDFDKGVTIVKEENAEQGRRSRRVSGFPECRYDSHDSGHDWSVFYVLKDGKLVTSKKDAKSIIEVATGVKLLKADMTPDFERKKRMGSSSYRVVTSDGMSRKWPRFYVDEQTDEHDLARDANNLREKVIKLSEETGFSQDDILPNVLSKETERDKDEVQGCIDKLRGIITMYSGIYHRKYEEEDENARRAYEVLSGIGRSRSRFRR
jgi:hypothetical protein